MTGASTLGLYLARVFVKWILGIFVLGALIITLADFVEFVRRAGDRETFTASAAILVAVLRTPSLAEEFLPFAVLFGAIGAFQALNRQLEIVVLRASGMSVWQFLIPPVLVALAIGVFFSLVYNPVSAAAREAGERLAASIMNPLIDTAPVRTGSLWFRQDGRDGPSIFNAQSSASNGRELFEVTALVFDKAGDFSARYQARTAVLEDGHWRLEDVLAYDALGRRLERDTVDISTYLDPIEIRDAVAQPDAISFWQLPAVASVAARAGLPVQRYVMQFQLLLSRPLLLASMVLVAATVSLRHTRMGGAAQAITGGVAAGFVLYLVVEVAGDLGRAGVVAPALAAWLPGAAAVLFGASHLLRTEDG